MTVRDELQHIYDVHGRLTSGLVVEAARPESHPLHHRFCWDDEEAAERYRLDQAEHLIRSVKIVVQAEEPTEIRAFLHVPSSSASGEPNSYVPESEVRDDPVKQTLVLGQMEREWRILKRRWGYLKHFWEVVSADAQEEDTG